MSQTRPNPPNLPEQIRLSMGTAIVAGLLNGKLDAKPTTAYLMTYKTGKCSANCGFCPQARASKSNTELLSRVTWPNFPTTQALNALGTAAKEGKIKRVCIQALNYQGVFLHLEALVKQIKAAADIPVSVSCQPLKNENIQLLKDAGVNRLGIALDAATKEIFNKVKGSGAGSFYSWENQFSQLDAALAVFGKGNVSTHLIVGLGETEKEAAGLVQRCVDMGVLPALFAFTPVRGTALEGRSQPLLESYRRMQLARYLLVHKLTRHENMRFGEKDEIADFGFAKEALAEIISEGKPFLTSGCPDCNRPFYNEKPSGPLYNYPREISTKELEEIKKQLLKV